MKLPQLNLRIPADYHQLIRDIAQRLRERDAASFAHELDAFLIGLPSAPPMAGAELAARVDGMEARLKVLEVLVLDTPAAPRPPVPPAEPIPPVPPAEPEGVSYNEIPEHIRSKAHGLKLKGMTWEAVWLELGRPGTVNGLRNAVGKWRKRYHVTVRPEED
jgi:hypothetical protein